MAAPALDKKRLWRDIQREHKAQARAKLATLKQQIRDARERRKVALQKAKTRCRTHRLTVRARVLEIRRAALDQLREAIRLERSTARQSCSADIRSARDIVSDVHRSRAELAAERQYQAEVRRIEQANRKRRQEIHGASTRERRSESDDEVRSNIPADLRPLFQRVRSSIRGSARMSRTEAFLKYAEEHPGEVLESLDDKTDAVIRELEARQEQAQRDVNRKWGAAGRVRVYSPAELAETPF